MYSTWFFIIIFRKALFPERLPNLKPKITKRANRHKSSLVNSWCLPFPGSDRSVMMRTQRARYHTDNKRPVQISSHVQISSLFYVALTIIAGFFFGILAKFKLGRKLLETFPGFFSFGTVSRQVINILFIIKVFASILVQGKRIFRNNILFWTKKHIPLRFLEILANLVK